MPIALIGVGLSVYQGIEAGKAADEQNQQAQQRMEANLGVASELRQRQQALVDTPLEEQIAALRSRELTVGAQRSQDVLQDQSGKISRGIMEVAPQTGEGVAGARLLTNQFNTAKGLAQISMEDEANKQARLPGLIQLGQQTPGWAGVETGANTQMANFAERQALQSAENEQSAYATAAQGMAALADQYAKEKADKEAQAQQRAGSGSPPPPSVPGLMGSSRNGR
jgi:hypothetical protein